MRKILALTSIRSEYDLMSSLFKLLHDDDDVELQLLVSGAHLSPEHGYTISNIREDGFNILAEIETLISADSLSSRLKTTSGLLSGSIDIVKKYSPDIIIYAGDREDVLIGGMLGLFLGIPTVHFFGGDHAADGHIDNPLRHATSKLSSAHLVSISEHKERLISLGEIEDRIFVIGSVALDKFIQEPTYDINLILKKMNASGHAYDAPLAIFIFHPINEEIEVAGEYAINAIRALIESGFHVCIGATNTDPGNFSLSQILEDLSLKDEVTYFKNLSRSEFVNLFRNAKIIVGNSSAGLLEAATIKIPAINIGMRQTGRLCNSNVIFTDGCYENISKSIQTAISEAFQFNLNELENLYGKGNSSEYAAELLKKHDFSAMVSKPEDPLLIGK